ncbi:MAG: hypothetical protein HW380_3569 [Magnetococcales bacterium]|nr:hypothetical protein [Magnetococcales bacterium]HIJ83422.1 hypothetical protein [Magnetococcales bacterium]
MSQTVTFDDVWKMFQEVSAQMRETDRKFQEMVREDRERRAELDRRFQETDRKFQETDRKFQETDREIKETGQQIKEVSSQMRDTDRKVKEVSQQVGNLGSRWGEFVEGIVAPACEALFAARGISVREVHPRVKANLPGNRHLEIDLLAVNGDVVIPIEVKSRLRGEDVRDFIRRLGELKEFMPRYADARVVGAVAGIVVDEGVDRHAMNEGLFVIVQSGDSVKLANDGEFVPRIW